MMVNEYRIDEYLNEQTQGVINGYTVVDWSIIREKLIDSQPEWYALLRESGRCGDCGKFLPVNYDKDTCPFCGLDLLPF